MEGSNIRRGRRKHKFRPVFSYDIEAIQLWLEEQAREGWFLRKQGMSNNLPMAAMEEGTPCDCRYRLVQSFRKGDLEEERAFRRAAREAGWEYLGDFNMFGVYRAMSETTMELHTEPQTQALELRKVRRNYLIWMAILWLPDLELIHAKGWLEHLRSPEGIRSVIIDLLILPCWIGMFYILTKFIHRLENGLPLSDDTDWRSRNRKLWIYDFALTCVLFVYLVYVVAMFAAQMFEAASSMTVWFG